MHLFKKLALIALAVLSTHARADVFNLRAVLQGNYYVSGTATIDPVTGLVTSENAAVFKNGMAVSTIAVSNPPQGAFTPAGLSPAYLFSGNGTNGYLFVSAVPGTSLVGFGGSELCSFQSTVHCARSDLFLAMIENDVLQGILAPANDVVKTFDLNGTFANGDVIVGKVTIDTTIGFILDETATLFSKGSIVDTFSNPGTQSVFAPGMPGPSYLAASFGGGGTLFNLAVPGSSLVGYNGGNLCAIATALNCAFSDIFLDIDTESDAVTGSLHLHASVPEPGVAALFGIGALILIPARRKLRLH